MPFLIVFLLLVFAFGLGASFYLTRRFRLGAVHTPAEVGLAFEEVSFPTADGLTLHGWLVPGASLQKAVILLHGHGGSIDYDIDFLPRLHAAGYSVLQFDFRGHGRSQGDTVTFGYLEQRDIQAAGHYLAGRGFQRIGVHGFSLGGMCALTGTPLTPEVSLVIDDAAPVRLRSAIRGWCLERGIPAWAGRPLAWLVLAATSLRLGVNIFAYEPVRWVGRIAPRPLMLIHGEHDQYVTDFDDLLAAAHPTEVWRLPNEGHTTACRSMPEVYWQRVIEFLNTHL